MKTPAVVHTTPHRPVAAPDASPRRRAAMELAAADALEGAALDTTEDLYCPITHELMNDPVICSDGHTYERAAIERWLRSHGSSPKTNAPLPNRTVLPNHNLRGIIETYKNKHGMEL